MILNVAKYFQEESKSGNKPQFRAGAVIAKTAAATGVSKNSVRKIVSVGKVIDEGKTRKAKVRFGKLDNFDVGVVRRIIHNLYRENISPSLKKILLQLKEKMNFPYGKTHLWRLLKKMGFGYEKRGRQRIISERPEIIAWRERHLRRIRKIREADPERAIVYTDETWLNQGHRTKKEWVDLETLKEENLRSLRLSGLTVGCTKEMTGKGRRLIISDAKNTENYPTSKWRKQQFVDWLTEKNITFPDEALRAELWTLVKFEREKFPDKVMETVAKEYGHEILRLPPPPLPL